jgi:hypothetical protein
MELEYSISPRVHCNTAYCRVYAVDLVYFGTSTIFVISSRNRALPGLVDTYYGKPIPILLHRYGYRQPCPQAQEDLKPLFACLVSRLS